MIISHCYFKSTFFKDYFSEKKCGEIYVCVLVISIESLALKP